MAAAEVSTSRDRPLIPAPAALHQSRVGSRASAPGSALPTAGSAISLSCLHLSVHEARAQQRAAAPGQPKRRICTSLRVVADVVPVNGPIAVVVVRHHHDAAASA